MVHVAAGAVLWRTAKSKNCYDEWSCAWDLGHKSPGDKAFLFRCGQDSLFLVAHN